MIEVRTSDSSYRIFLILMGHAFENSTTDVNPSHGFYWAMRWLARQVLGPAWIEWLGQ